ncbi:uncharacterized protein [Acropora muricata]|uniref:uncharacterized protein n=1 Tax=Acropora muricata TaxID=159855 RepID=UPI0034E47777
MQVMILVKLDWVSNGEAGKWSENKSFPVLPGPKEDQGHLGKTGAQGPQGARREKGQDGTGTSCMNYVGWRRTSCLNGSQIFSSRDNWWRTLLSLRWWIKLPLSSSHPKADKYKNGHHGAASVYGTEYQIIDQNGNPFDRNLHDHDAPCAVCFVGSRDSMVMMPARNDCPSGWTKEYHGYLMTAYHGQKHSTEFVCIDAHGSKEDKDGALLYPVEGLCGSLPCLPYVAGRELTCAVCTK